jgi:hypothetical protein
MDSFTKLTPLSTDGVPGRGGRRRRMKMSKRKVMALLLLSGSYTLALGLNCLPNIGGAIPSIPALINQLLGR